MGSVVILMGSGTDLEFCKEIARHLKAYGLGYVLRVASAHKTPKKVLDILREYEKEDVVYVTVAGRSNALSAFVDANTARPVIACPPYSEKYGGADVFSSLRVPSGIGCSLVVEPEAAAIAAAKMLAISDKDLEKRVKDSQTARQREIEKADSSIAKLR